MEMIKNLFKANFFTTGLAMFAMFFGSGNLIFPVAIGQMAGEQNGWAMAGLFFTAVLMPFATLCLMLLYNGNYHRFFQKIGVLPGQFVAFVTLALIGPFGVLPRCIAFSYSTLSIYTDALDLTQYSIIACVIVFALSVKENSVVGVIGNFLTPVLLVSLVVVIARGLLADHIPLTDAAQNASNWVMMQHGFVEGYKTFDIFAALFFATAIIPAFRQVLGNKMETCKKSLMSLAIRSSMVGMVLLFLVYAGLSFVSANLRGGLVGVPGDKLLGVIATMTMGNTAGLIANLVVSLACLTTAISLAVVSAEFFKRDVFFNRLSYLHCLIITMIITLLFSLLGFSGIMRLVLPILMVICPAVITLVVANALNYFFGFKYIKVPVYGVFVISLIMIIL
jgi:branched-chain amino acid:cation transporter, LIVCS family